MQNKYFILCVLLSISIINVSAQNMVPNPSFEDTLSCPTSQAQIYNAPPWFQPTANTPDYFNPCYTSGLTNVDVPTNFEGYQFARMGMAYAGFGCKYSAVNGREYIEVRLLDSLTSGKKYCVEFYVSLSDSSTVALSNIGAYLSKDSIYETGFYIINLPYIPQIENPSGNIIYDKINWIKISGEYIAGGGEKFITIGNFRNDGDTNADTLNPNPFVGKAAYYYIDDVSVSLCDSVPEIDSAIYVPNAFSPNGDGENDVFFVQGSLEELHCEIFTRWGERVAELTMPKQGWDGRVNGIECNTGVYFFYLTGRDKNGKEIRMKGNVTLLR